MPVLSTKRTSGREGLGSQSEARNVNNNDGSNGGYFRTRRTPALGSRACVAYTFNLHRINRVSGRARNANTRYVYALGPSPRIFDLPSGTGETEVAVGPRDARFCMLPRIVAPVIYDSINKSATFYPLPDPRTVRAHTCKMIFGGYAQLRSSGRGSHPFFFSTSIGLQTLHCLRVPAANCLRMDATFEVISVTKIRGDLMVPNETREVSYEREEERP